MSGRRWYSAPGLALAMTYLLGVAELGAAPASPGVVAPTAAGQETLPVPPDTAVVDLGWPTAGAGTLVDASPDTLLLGEICRLVFADVTVAVPDSLPWPAWLEPVAVTRPADGAGSLAIAVRPYRLGPFRILAEDGDTVVVLVVGRLADAGTTAPVRAPRAPGWNLLALVLAAAGLVLLAGCGWWLARRRWRGGPLGRDRTPPPAAWPRTAVALEALLAEGLLPGGEREFLDGLTALVRTHVARRFLVHGREMTADEIATACARLGYERPAARPFVGLVAEVDRRRYDPEPVYEAYCRERVARFLDAVAKVRIEPVAGTLPTAEITAGETAWRRLRAEFAPAGDEGGE